MSIKKTLRITLLIFSIVPIILLSILAYHLIAERLLTVKQESLKQLAETNSNGLQALVKNQQTEINLLSLQSQIKDLASLNQKKFATNSISYKKAYDKSMDLLASRSKSYPACEKITVYNEDKQVIASSKSSEIGNTYADSLTLSYIKATGATASGVSGLIKYKTDDMKKIYCIEIGCPILDESNPNPIIIGYIVSTLQISYFSDFLSSITIGDSGFGMVLDKNGEIIYHPKYNLIGTNINNERLGNLISDYYSGKITRTGNFIYTLNSVDGAYGYSVIPELDWVMLVKQDVAEIIDLARIILYILIWTILALILLMLLVSDKITNIYTAPILELKDTMRTASDGNLNVQSNIKSNNEFGELSRSLNKMLHIIRSNYNELTAMHEELVTNEEELRTNYNRIEFLAYHDVLTELPNKMAFIERVNSTLTSSPGSNKIHAIYFVDLDNFKTVNDTLGHDYGDILLAQTAGQLLSLTTSDDTLARAGGDEFLIFKENLKSEKDAVEYAASIIEAFKLPFNLNGEITYVSMSIGIALYPKNGNNHSALIKNADIAMYKSKDTGKNKYTLFNKSMEEELNRNTIILEVLRHAIANEEIYIKYQPQFSILTNNMIGFEALMRINSSKLGELKPNEFIPIAEESGLIVELGEWILRKACEFNKSLVDLGFKPLVVSVNISSVQIKRSGFIDTVSEILRSTGLSPSCLELEITESTIVSSITDASVLFNGLQSLGVKISLDDFGTGYSSLNYLTTMPINTLKMDKSFINNISHNKKDSFIADTIINLAHSIEVEVIAEGVESEDQLDILKRKNCDIIQGFLYSKPLYPSALISLLEKDI